MANTGNIFPVTGENNAGIGATAWTAPTAIVSDNASNASCNAAASSQYLVARNFGFTLPSTAIISGITVRVEAAETSTSTEALFGQLQNESGALVGSSKNQVINGTGATVYTYGATNDVWGATLTPAVVNDADFGVRLWFITAHNITVDYVTLAIEYTDHKNITAGVGAIVVTGQAPTVAVTNNKNISADVGAIVLAGFSPSVVASDHKNIAADFGQVLITGFAPTVQTPKMVVTDKGDLVITGFAPSVDVTTGSGQNVTPGVGALSLDGFAPSVSVTDHKIVSPQTGALLLSGFAPVVETPVNINTALGQLILNGFAPSVAISGQGEEVETFTGELLIEGYAPIVTIAVRKVGKVGNRLLFSYMRNRRSRR